MIQQIKIDQIFKNDKDRDGKPLVSEKSGVPYWKVDIYSSSIRYSGFAKNESEPHMKWEVGQTVKIELVKREKNGVTYNNYTVPNEGDLWKELINDRVSALEEEIRVMKGPKPTVIPEHEDVDPSQIPF